MAEHTPDLLPPRTTGRLPNEDLLEPGESVLRIVRRHSIGIVMYFAVAFAAIMAFLVLIHVLAPDFLNDDSGGTLIRTLIVVGLLFVGMMLLVLVYVYRQNQLLITDRSLVQITQLALFNRRISRLSMSNVEDVSAAHSGILPSIFNYGTLVVQTAGERENFIFKFCPDPNHYADMIIEARQAYARRNVKAEA
jgi:hypothetical protein